MEQKVATGDKYLTVDQHEKFITDFMQYVENGKIEDVRYLRHSQGYILVPALINSFVSWNAGFRGYSLRRFARGRTMTLMLPMLSASSACLYNSMALKSLMSPFQEESLTAFGIKYAMYHQLSHITTTSAGLIMTFFFAQRSGALLIPQKTYIFKIPIDSFIEFYSRLKPYRYSMLASWIGATAFSFALGAATYNQSREILKNRFNRRTFCLVEE